MKYSNLESTKFAKFAKFTGKWKELREFAKIAKPTKNPLYKTKYGKVQSVYNQVHRMLSDFEYETNQLKRGIGNSIETHEMTAQILESVGRGY